MSNFISASSFITFIMKSIRFYSPSIFTKASHLHASALHISPYTFINRGNAYSYTHLTLNPRPLTSSITATATATFTTPSEVPSRRVPEVDPATPSEMPQIKTYPDEFIVVPEPEIQQPIPPPDPVPNPPGPEFPDMPIPSPPGPEIVPPPETPPPRQPPDVYPPNAPEILPPPSTPTPDIVPPTGPMVV